jgi:hypothetical protein
MVSAAAVFAPRGLPLAKVDDIGVFEHVADAHVDTFAGGGLAQSAQKLKPALTSSKKGVAMMIALFP